VCDQLLAAADCIGKEREDANGIPQMAYIGCIVTHRFDRRLWLLSVQH
jgi:hypothetical protein